MVPASARQGVAEAGPTGVPEVIPCEGAEILARVGSDIVLASELLGAANEIIAQNKDRIPAHLVKQQRDQIVQQLLQQRIQLKLIYQDAKRKIPAENLDKVKEKIAEQFDKSEIPEQMKRAKVDSRRELEEKLHELGTSLTLERESFVQKILAQQWLREQINLSEEVTHDQMLTYYQEHLADYQISARARWQQLMVRKSRFKSNAAAHAAAAAMGNKVLDGVSFEQVAKADSDGVTAAEGGTREWTTRGSLVSEVLDRAIFGLPEGRLSRVLEDEQGFHIVRVIERQEDSVTPFREAQVGIREAISEGRREKQIEDYLARLNGEIPVWTVYGDLSSQ